MRLLWLAGAVRSASVSQARLYNSTVFGAISSASGLRCLLFVHSDEEAAQTAGVGRWAVTHHTFQVVSGMAHPAQHEDKLLAPIWCSRSLHAGEIWEVIAFFYCSLPSSHSDISLYSSGWRLPASPQVTASKAIVWKQQFKSSSRDFLILI